MCDGTRKLVGNDAAVDFHSAIADKFDEAYRVSADFEERLVTFRELFSRYLEGKSTVLDVGCGSGRMSIELSRMGLDVSGIDGSPKMIALCQRAKEDHRLSNTEFFQGQVPEDLDRIALQHFDAIVMSSVIEYLPDLDGTLDAIAGKLGPDGILIVSVPNRRSVYRRLEKVSFGLLGVPGYLRFVRHQFSDEEFSERLRQKGMECLEVRYFAGNNFVSKVLSPVLREFRVANLFVGVYVKENQ